MCFGSGSKDAQYARIDAQIERDRLADEEKERQARILEGQTAIDKEFEQFTPQYYTDYQQTAIDAATPDIEDQYARANDKLTAQLAGRRILNSNIAGNLFSDVEKKRADVLGQIADDAVTQARDLKTAVEAQKTDLYSLNLASSDPAAIANRAAGEATALVGQPVTSKLSDVFSSIVEPVSSYAKADAYSPYGGKIRDWFSPSSGTSTKVYK